jgi:hypothetical protein
MKNKPGRPKGSSNKERRKVKSSGFKGLRLKLYSDMPCSDGGVVSGHSDQYGRIMEQYENSRGESDIRPTGQCIAARH